MIEPYATGRGWSLYLAQAEIILPRLEPGSVDALVTDPPYSSGGFARGDRAESLEVTRLRSRRSTFWAEGGEKEWITASRAPVWWPEQQQGLFAEVAG